MKRYLSTVLPVAALVLAVLSLGAALVSAQTPPPNTPPYLMTCLASATTTPAQLNTAAACNSMGFKRQYVGAVNLAAGMWVLTCVPTADAACKPGLTNVKQPAWGGDTNYNWQKWPVAATNGVLVCNKAGISLAVFPVTTADPCTPSEDDVAKPLVLASTFMPISTANPATFGNVLQFTVTFTCPNGAIPTPVPTVVGPTVTIPGPMCPLTATL